MSNAVIHGELRPPASAGKFLYGKIVISSLYSIFIGTQKKSIIWIDLRFPLFRT